MNPLLRRLRGTLLVCCAWLCASAPAQADRLDVLETDGMCLAVNERRADVIGLRVMRGGNAELLLRRLGYSIDDLRQADIRLLVDGATYGQPIGFSPPWVVLARFEFPPTQSADVRQLAYSINDIEQPISIPRLEDLAHLPAFERCLDDIGVARYQTATG
ncbi:MAG: hypothetical protein ACFB3T_14900 [Geminicoccaceae bacterium]